MTQRSIERTHFQAILFASTEIPFYNAFLQPNTVECFWIFSAQYSHHIIHSIHFVSASAFVCVEMKNPTHAYAHIHKQGFVVSTHYHVSQRNREKFKRNSLLWIGYTLAIAMPTTAATKTTTTTTTQLYAKEWVTFANIDFSSSFWNCYSSFLALTFEHFISWIQYFPFLKSNVSRIVCD